MKISMKNPINLFKKKRKDERERERANNFK